MRLASAPCSRPCSVTSTSRVISVCIEGVAIPQSAITGTPIHYFAYPFGLWNPPALPELRKRGFIMAFQLADKMDRNDPLLTVRRIIVGGGWSLKTFDAAIKRDFH